MLSRLPGESVPQSQKILRKISKFLGFWHFCDLTWWLVHEWKLQSWAYSEGFATPFETCLRVDFRVAKKNTWTNFSKFCQGILATHFGDLLASQSSHKNRVFCINRVKSKTVFKHFSVFPRITCTLIVLSASPSPKTSIFTHKTFIFFINLQEKVWVFSYFQSISSF